ncbi:hypothetical protein [Rhizobium leguminosarum]|uniref:hypothetical protein n=1 Tax=Rhizobium leguminosarum TaxID=384 RepID=UPI002E103892|nr:hypothetical protein U8Q02_36945 [Rhizobium leguminosarum]
MSTLLDKSTLLARHVMIDNPEAFAAIVAAEGETSVETELTRAIAATRRGKHVRACRNLYSGETVDPHRQVSPLPDGYSHSQVKVALAKRIKIID